MTLSKQINIKILALCGIIFVVFDVIMYNILAALRPGYNRLTDAISLLGAEGTSNADYASATFIMSGILTIFFAIGLHQVFDEENRNKKSLIFIILFGLFDSIGSGIFPCDAGCAGETPTGQMHMLVSLVGLISMCLALIFISKNVLFPL